MARGWESKEVASQIEQAAGKRKAEAGQPAQPETESDVRRRTLSLNRTRILEEAKYAQHPRFRAQLDAALAYLDAELAKLGGPPDEK
jgi:hypothetical protein